MKMYTDSLTRREAMQAIGNLGKFMEEEGEGKYLHTSCPRGVVLHYKRRLITSTENNSILIDLELQNLPLSEQFRVPPIHEEVRKLFPDYVQFDICDLPFFLYS